jgi:twinkle protein
MPTANAKRSEKLHSPLVGEYRPLSTRKIDEKTCRMYGYRLAKAKDGQTVHVSDYWRDGAMVAQHVRFQKPKDFRWKGDASIDTLPLYGQWLWSGEGKRIVVTEGEIDCLTISHLWKNRWPVVSLPSGIQSSEHSIRANLAFLSGYDEIVLCFDNDEPGRLYAEKCAEILPPGKVKICHLPLKDANEMHLKGQGPAVLQSIYEARSFQPDGILHAGDIVSTDKPVQAQWTYPWGCLTRGLMGQRSGEMTLWASGTGSGKSTVMREVAYHHLLRGRKVGLLMLEESPAETLDDLIALHINKPVRQIRAARELNALLQAEGGDALDFGYPDNLTEEEYEEARQWFAKTGCYIYDHHGTNEFGNVLQRIEYMASGLGVDVIVCDHVTAMVAGMERNGSERESIDEIMKTLRSIVERTGCHVDIVSQLNRLDGKAAEEGGQISLKNLRGSGSLGSVPNTVLAIERDQQADDPEERRIIKVRVLKGRFTGDTGIAGMLKFNPATRRLNEAEWCEPTGDTHAGSTLEPEDLDAAVEPVPAAPAQAGAAA